MKIFILVFCVMICEAATAQQKNESSFKSFYDIIKEKSVPGKAAFPFPVTRKKQEAVSKVMILPLDNMPCLVPDMSNFNMPVAGQNTIIPNTMPVLRQVIPVK